MCRPNTEPDPQRMLLFGDSIAWGLGVKSERYAECIAGELGLQLIDYSGAGTTVEEGLARFRAGPSAGVIALIAHGVTEAIIRPSERSLRLLPRRWRRRGWMDPRPYYSRRLRKRGLERLESATRWRVKNALIRSPKTRWQVLDIDTYRENLRLLVGELSSRDVKVVIVGPPAISERFFPGSQAEQDRYAEVAASMGVAYVSLRDELDRWDDYFADRFHPNQHGHARIAQQLLPRVRSLLDEVVVHGGTDEMHTA